MAENWSGYEDLSWREHYWKHTQIIMEYLRDAHGIERPNAAEEMLGNPRSNSKFHDHYLALDVASAIVNARLNEAADHPDNLLVPYEWQDSNSYRTANLAFMLAKACEERGVKYQPVVEAYASAVLHSDPPDFSSMVPGFEQDTYQAHDGSRVSGMELLKEARKKALGPRGTLDRGQS